jgi:hypothetical protein
MKVIPFYTSTGMRDAERVTSQDALLCPTYKLLPFQIQRDHLAGTYTSEVKLVDCNGAETDISSYFLGSEALITSWTNYANPIDFDTFASSGTTILTAIESGAATALCYTDEFALATGEAIAVDYNLTLNSGTLPTLLLGSLAATAYSTEVTTVAGGDTIYLEATGNSGGNVRLYIKSTAPANTSFGSTFSSVKRTNLRLSERTTYDFLTYNGEPLSTTLAYGVYYVRVSDGNTTWYSEWLNVQKLQPQLITGYGSDTYDTFTPSGANVASAINLAGSALAFTNSLSAFNGEIFIFTYDLTLNSGSYPNVRLVRSAGGDTRSNIETLADGLNEVEIIPTVSDTMLFRISSTSASNFSLGSVSLRRKAGDYVHIEYTNSRDFNNGDDSILYTSTGGFTQQAYLRSYLNLPSHESIEVGDEKNGVFVAEKLVRKYSRSIVSYESRSMYNALSLLKHHDTIKILDEEGVEYTPSVGNVDVSMDWNTFDTGSLRIVWNETGDVWTNSMSNIT